MVNNAAMVQSAAPRALPRNLLVECSINGGTTLLVFSYAPQCLAPLQALSGCTADVKPIVNGHQ